MAKRRKLKSVNTMAKKAMKEAVAGVMKDHARTGDPIYVSEKGRIVRIAASQLRGKK